MSTKKKRIDKFIDLYVYKKYTISSIADKLGVHRDTIYRYLRIPQVQDKIKKEEAKIRDKYNITKEFMIEQLLELYHTAEEENPPDKKTMLDCLKQLAKMAGLDKTEVELNLNNVITALSIKPKENNKDE